MNHKVVKHSSVENTKLTKLKKHDLTTSRFSKTNLAIFAALFALIGGYFLFKSFAAAAPGIAVSGTQVLKDGQPFIMRGVNRSGPEYICRTSAGFFDGPNATNDSAQITAMKTWGINTVNIPFNEDCWLGINENLRFPARS
jgi:hypothetical protein